MRRIASGEVEQVRRAIEARLSARPEWLCAEVGRADGRQVTLRGGEWSLTARHGRLLFSYWGDYGQLLWSITNWDCVAEQVILEASRRAGAERVILKLTPRASVRQEVEALRDARLRALSDFARIVRDNFNGATIERATLSPGAHPGVPGRYARLIVRLKRGAAKRVAVTGDIAAAPQRPRGSTGAGENLRHVMAFLAGALLWFGRQSAPSPTARSQEPAISRLHLLASSEAETAELARFVSLLRADLRAVIVLKQIDCQANRVSAAPQSAREQLFAARGGAASRARLARSFASPAPGEWAAKIAALCPDDIDAVRSRGGETLRFRGFAFARVRKLGDAAERAWFGAERKHRRLVTEENWPEVIELVEDLRRHRSFDALDRRHAFYRHAPEAWLETMLRRDIARLDPGLIISPLYAQFCAAAIGADARRPARRHTFDLLALRRDGRLALIELKVSEDRLMALQVAEYWARVEALRRAGVFEKFDFFGAPPDRAGVADLPPLVYCVAPLLSFAPSFERFARMLDPAIELYRFDLNEDWRRGVRVARRRRVR